MTAAPSPLRARLEAVALLILGAAMFAVTTFGHIAPDKADRPPVVALVGVVLFFIGAGKSFFLLMPALTRRFGSALLLIGCAATILCVALHYLPGLAAGAILAIIGLAEILIKAAKH